MKIRITAKDPDGVGNSIQEAICESVADLKGLDQDERDDVMDRRSEKIRDIVGRYVTYEEYITIEIDSETGLATVVPAG